MLRAAFQRPGRAIAPAAARGWCSSWRSGGVALVILCLSVYLPGLWSIPPVDRDESRFAQASRTMLESGDLVIPRIQDKPRLNKPPLIYWLQSASAAILGDTPTPDGLGRWGNGNIWVYRLPSVLCAIGSVLLTWRLGLRLFDSRAALLAAALLAVCPMVVWDAHQARADQLLLLTTTATMLALFVCWKQAIRRVARACDDGVARAACPPVELQQSRKCWSTVAWPCIFWLSLSLGILTKGPITPLIAALAISALSFATRSFRWTRHLRPLLGLLIVAATVGPWVYAVIDRVGWGTYISIIKDETLGRSLESKEGHWAPPGYHTVLLAALFWPGSLLTLGAIIRAARSIPWRTSTRPLARRRADLFLLAWLLPAWLVFELIATKLPHYTMPLYPAIALLSGRAVFSSLAAITTLGARIGLAMWTGVGFFGLTLAIVFIAGAGAMREHVTPVHLALGVAYLVFLATMLALAHRDASRSRTLAAHAIAIGATVSWCWITLAGVLPASRDLWVSPRLVELISRASPAAATPIALVGFQEDSAIFLLRGRATRIEPNALASWLADHPDGVVAVDVVQFPAAAISAFSRLQLAGGIDGFNYSTGKRVSVQVYSPRPQSLSTP